MSKQPRHWTYREERLRADVLRAANYQCTIRGPGCTGRATEVDHIHPKAWGGLATRDNLRAACRPCNRSKGARAEVQDENRFFNQGQGRRGPLPKLPPLRCTGAVKARKISPWKPVVRDYSQEPEK